MYGYIRVSMVINGYVKVCMGIYKNTWIYKGMYQYRWIYLGIWVYMEIYSISVSQYISRKLCQNIRKSCDMCKMKNDNNSQLNFMDIEYQIYFDL